MKRGMFFAIDAIVALALLGLMVAMAFMMLEGIGTPPLEESNAALLGYDSLAALEKNNTLAKAVDDRDFRQLEEFLTILPTDSCAILSLYTHNLTFIGSMHTVGCTAAPDTAATVRRTFVLQDKSFCVAEMRTWQR